MNQDQRLKKDYKCIQSILYTSSSIKSQAALRAEKIIIFETRPVAIYRADSWTLNKDFAEWLPILIENF